MTPGMFPIPPSTTITNTAGISNNGQTITATNYSSASNPVQVGVLTPPTVTKSFDLLWRGIELTTGAQREHRYERLLSQANDKHVDVPPIQYYLDFFRFGAPPHGGFGFGLTRLLMQLLGQDNVREVTFLYRGPHRLEP